MSHPNPYHASLAQEPQHGTAAATEGVVNQLDTKVAHYAQAGLRLIGMFFLIEGMISVGGSVVYAVVQAARYASQGYAPIPDEYACGWFVSALLSLAAGFYLLVSSERVVRKVFVPARTLRNGVPGLGD